jgi:hypothetical protein
MRIQDLELTRVGNGVAIAYDETPMVVELGIGIPLHHRWRWSFDGSLHLMAAAEEPGTDSVGDYTALVCIYADEAGPLVQQRLHAYANGSSLLAETTALRDLHGTALADSFFHTTFNSPVLRLADGLRYLVYTWGLEGGEGAGIGGHFPDAAIASALDRLPEQLQRADFSPTTEAHQTGEKPFAPLIAYDDQERTLVVAPLNHFLISPMRLLNTPVGVGVARGLHGAVDCLPAGTTTRTALVFGRGLVPTVLQWGDLLLRTLGKRRGKGRHSTLVKSLGFWNCYGGYYADLFRPTDASTLRQLSRYFQGADLPVRYFGLDLWYCFDQVGFARNYCPHPDKYPQGLQAVCAETGLPFLLHMSAFDPANDYLEAYDFVRDEGSAYPARPAFYHDRAREFKAWGAIGIWPDFLRTQLQHCRSLRDCLHTADGWFDGLCQAMAGEGLEVMLCMPTVGHYLASAGHDNVIAVRTSTDYVNHQRGQLEILGRHLEEYRIPNSPLRNLRQNLLLSLLAGAVGLAPSYDVFITNQHHPEGFAEPDAPREALLRALSSGIVGIGDKLDWVDKAVVDRLAFPDGTLAQPDHPLYPVASTLQSEVLAVYTTTTVGACRWTYLVLLNLSAEEQGYRLALEPFLEDKERLIYDYLAGQRVVERQLVGVARPGEIRYLVFPPQVGGLHLLGFVDKYVPLSGRQVKGIQVEQERVSIDLELPAGRSYTFAVWGANKLTIEGRGIRHPIVEHREGLAHIRFQVDTHRCHLLLQA